MRKASDSRSSLAWEAVSAPPESVFLSSLASVFLSSTGGLAPVAFLPRILIFFSAVARSFRSLSRAFFRPSRLPSSSVSSAFSSPALSTPVPSSPAPPSLPSPSSCPITNSKWSHWRSWSLIRARITHVLSACSGGGPRAPSLLGDDVSVEHVVQLVDPRSTVLGQFVADLYAELGLDRPGPTLAGLAPLG